MCPGRPGGVWPVGGPIRIGPRSAPAEGNLSPSARTVTLNQHTLEGRADFVISLSKGEVIVVYSLDKTPRTRNIAAQPKVCLNLNSTPAGGEVVIIEGIAEIMPAGRPAHEDERYVAKYEGPMEDLGMTPESFAADYPVRIHVQPTRLRAS